MAFTPEQKREHKRKRRAKGLCVECGAVAIKGQQHCTKHARIVAKASRTYSRKMIEQGRCATCGVERDGKPIYCTTCHEKRLESKRMKDSL